jgi:putative hydrolase of the HAD superfamily
MFDWNDIDTVLLDMDGTLLDLHFDNYFWLTHLPKRYAETHGVDEAEATQKLHSLIRAHEGTLAWYCIDFWADELKIDILSLKEEVQHKIQIRPFVIEFLQALKQNNKKLVLITNAHPGTLDIKLERTKIDSCLDMIISSHQFNQPKEAQAFWHSLQEFEHFDPQRTLFIDDTVKILDSARDFGIKHLLCIHQPDSQKERFIKEYPAIHHFDEIMPVNQNDG